MLRRVAELSPTRIYFVHVGLSSLAYAFAATLQLVYQVKVVGLSPLQLVLVGTVLEATVLLFEVPTGVLADRYSRRLSIIVGAVLSGTGFLVQGLIPEFWAALACSLIWGIGFTAPSILGQAAVVSEAMLRAGVGPTDIRLVEAHGTGTPLGDPIEVAGLVTALGTLGTPVAGSCAIGSVKGNIGHLGHAAGIASLIKTVLCLEHGSIVPSGSFRSLNPKLELEGTPFYVAAAADPVVRPRASGSARSR